MEGAAGNRPALPGPLSQHGFLSRGLCRVVPWVVLAGLVESLALKDLNSQGRSAFLLRVPLIFL